MLISQHAVAEAVISLQRYGSQSRRKLSCKCTRATGNTDFDLKGSSFIPIAGILELVNRTLVNGVPMLTWGKKGGKWKGGKKKTRKRNE